MGTGIYNETCGDEGPTGEIREVTRCYLVDAGDNVVLENVTNEIQIRNLLERWRGGSLYAIEQEVGEVVDGYDDGIFCGHDLTGK